MTPFTLRDLSSLTQVSTLSLEKSHVSLMHSERGAGEEPLLVFKEIINVDLVGPMIGSCSWLLIYTKDRAMQTQLEKWHEQKGK